jgi:hypothetical protein
MGLDQYAYAVKKGKIEGEVDFCFKEYDDEYNLVKVNVEDEDFEEIAYWRKHADLQGWMRKLYDKKGGESNEFNCNKLLLTEEDLDNLEKDVRKGKLPKTTGFFFGNGNTDGYAETDLNFISKAREYISNGYDIVYDSWW